MKNISKKENLKEKKIAVEQGQLHEKLDFFP